MHKRGLVLTLLDLTPYCHAIWTTLEARGGRGVTNAVAQKTKEYLREFLHLMTPPYRCVGPHPSPSPKPLPAGQVDE